MISFFKKLLKGALDWYGRRTVEAKLPELQKLMFFNGYHPGPAVVRPCNGWLREDGCFTCYSPLAITVHCNGKLSGLIGFELLPSWINPLLGSEQPGRRTILIQRMKGAPDAAYPKGMKAAEYLLFCAEEIARVLEMQEIQVITAETMLEYHEAGVPDEPLKEYEVKRINTMYGHPASRGYIRTYSARLRQEVNSLVLPVPHTESAPKMPVTTPQQRTNSLDRQPS